jgi:hypothetical protein
LVTVEGTPRSHARGSSTVFDDISGATTKSTPALCLIGAPHDLADVRRRDVLGGLIHEYELAA